MRCFIRIYPFHFMDDHFVGIFFNWWLSIVVLFGRSLSYHQPPLSVFWSMILRKTKPDMFFIFECIINEFIIWKLIIIQLISGGNATDRYPATTAFLPECQILSDIVKIPWSGLKLIRMSVHKWIRMDIIVIIKLNLAQQVNAIINGQQAFLQQMISHTVKPGCN